MMDVEEIKKDFPQFTSNPNLVYLDSAASSLTPEPVITAITDYYRTYRANIHRGLYREAQKASKQYERAREAVAGFIDAFADEVIFTAGATMSANMLVYALQEMVAFGINDEIVVTTMDHHASLLPLQALAQRTGARIEKVGLNGNVLQQDEIVARITPRTKLVAITLASNVLGTIQDTASIVKKARTVGAYVFVDATSVVGHVPLSVKTLGVDALFFSGHKLCGPTGVGVLYGTRAFLKALPPSFFGGGIVDDVTDAGAVWKDAPVRFEAGTPNIAGVIGLMEAVRYLERIGVDAIHAHTHSLISYLQTALKNIKGVDIFSAPPEKNVGIVSFSLSNVHPHDVAEIASKHNVAVRAGHHCALPLHRALGVPATTRASVYLYNTKEDVDALIACIEEAKSIFND
jgi:cysteine desulfurase/selenocysteine lyase